jgi:hypothetical protein
MADRIRLLRGKFYAAKYSCRSILKRKPTFRIGVYKLITIVSGLITAVALEDLGRMRELVGAQHPVASKGLAARVADVGPVALVLILVRLQVGHRLTHRDSVTRFDLWELIRLGQIFQIFGLSFNLSVQTFAILLCPLI